MALGPISNKGFSHPLVEAAAITTVLAATLLTTYVALKVFGFYQGEAARIVRFCASILGAVVCGAGGACALAWAVEKVRPVAEWALAGRLGSPA